LKPRNGVTVSDGSKREVVEAALSSADLFLLPSRIECSPLVIIESMAASLPWISYDVGNVRELAGGIVVDDPIEMARATVEVLDGRHPDLGAEGKAAWESGHRWDTIVSSYEALLDRVREIRRAAPRSETLTARPE
jgi:glycosyltransferase involved in cell wall biosynthesis